MAWFSLICSLQIVLCGLPTFVIVSNDLLLSVHPGIAVFRVTKVVLERNGRLALGPAAIHCHHWDNCERTHIRYHESILREARLSQILRLNSTRYRQIVKDDQYCIMKAAVLQLTPGVHWYLPKRRNGLRSLCYPIQVGFMICWLRPTKQKMPRADTLHEFGFKTIRDVSCCV